MPIFADIFAFEYFLQPFTYKVDVRTANERFQVSNLKRKWSN